MKTQHNQTNRQNLSKLKYFGHLMHSQLTGKDPDAGEDWRQEKRTGDEMVGWHHQLTWYEFEQTLGDGEGQDSLVCCSPWGHKESDTTAWLSCEVGRHGLEFMLVSVWRCLKYGCNIKKNKILPFAETRMQPEIIKLSQVKSESKDKYHMKKVKGK